MFNFSIGLFDHLHAPQHYFHSLGLWDKDMVNDKGWKLATLDTIVKQLGHTGVSSDTEVWHISLEYIVEMSA